MILHFYINLFKLLYGSEQNSKLIVKDTFVKSYLQLFRCLSKAGEWVLVEFITYRMQIYTD